MSITPASARENGSILTSCVADYYCHYQMAVRYSRLRYFGARLLTLTMQAIPLLPVSCDLASLPIFIRLLIVLAWKTNHAVIS
jgi:hypothetical protein